MWRILMRSKDCFVGSRPQLTGSGQARPPKRLLTSSLTAPATRRHGTISLNQSFQIFAASQDEGVVADPTHVEEVAAVGHFFREPAWVNLDEPLTGGFCPLSRTAA